MSPHRFLVPPDTLTAETAEVPEPAARQIRQVLRLRPGEDVVLFDGGGSEWLARLETVSKERVSAMLLQSSCPDTEAIVSVTLSQVLLKSDRFEFVLQKATELGVQTVQPVLSERCIADSPSPSRLERWERILREATEQSGRVRVPSLLPVVRLDEAIAPEHGPAVMLWESEKDRSLSRSLADLAGTGRLNLICGPEGGFATGEAERMRNSGVAVASLGPRILRAETAAVTALTISLYALGELEPPPPA